MICTTQNGLVGDIITFGLMIPNTPSKYVHLSLPSTCGKTVFDIYTASGSLPQYMYLWPPLGAADVTSPLVLLLTLLLHWCACHVCGSLPQLTGDV